MRPLFYKPDAIETERRQRIRLSIAAYQYEFEPDNPAVMTDVEFDKNMFRNRS